jgi:hypothetical protein
MLSKKTRANAAGLFEELIEAWGRAKKAVAQDVPARTAIQRQQPELALSGRVLNGLSRLGYDLDVNDFVGTYRDRDTKQVFHERMEDVPALPPSRYSGFVPVTDELFQTLEAVLRTLWNKATGHLKSQPRFIPPAARSYLEIDPAVAEQKARLRSYTRTKPRPRKAPNRPPRYVVVCEGDGYTCKTAGLGPSAQPKVESQTIPAGRLVGNVKAIMDFIQQEFFRLHGTRYRITKDTDIRAVRRLFGGIQPVVVTYADLYRLSQTKAGKRVKRTQALSTLSATAKLPTKTMAVIRKQVARFNQFWRDETGDDGTWLAPDPAHTGKGGGAWKAQVMLLLPPDEDEE